MKRSYSVVTLLLSLIAFCAQPVFADTPVKRVLIEEFTGAWCPWCIDGPVRLEEIHKKVGDQMIAVAIHDNDSMTTDEYNKGGWHPMAPFFPAGMINRIYYPDAGSGKVGIDRAAWEEKTLAELAKPAVCDVTITKCKFDAATRTLTVTVNADFVTDVQGEVRLNAYIVESGIVGKGTGWDQANAYNSLAGSEKHPWYGKGSPVKGFVHNHVFRAAMGGAWGQAKSVPSTITNGTNATTTLTYVLPASWNSDNIEVVGIVERYDNDVNKCEILNCCEREVAPAPSRIFSQPNLVVATEASGATNHFSVANQTEAAQTYVVTLKKSDRTPQDWTVALTQPLEFSVDANSKKTLDASLVPGTTPGVGDLIVNISPKSDPSQVYATSTYTVLHKDCASLELMIGDAKTSLHTNVTGSGRTGYWTIQPMSSSWTELMKLRGLKSVIINAADNIDFSGPTANGVQALNDGGAGILVTGNAGALSMISNTSFAAEAGIAAANESTLGVDKSGKFVAFNAEGASGDPIAAGMSLSCTPVGSKIRVLDFSVPQNARAMIQSSSDAKVFAVDAEMINARCAILPALSVFGAKQDELLAKTLTWLEGAAPSARPILRTFDNLDPQMIDFKTVEINKTGTQNFVLRNTGRGDLIVSSFDWLGGTEDTDVFSISGIDLPCTISPGATKTMMVSFKPKDPTLVLNTVLSVKSNAANSPDYQINVVAQASEVLSVEPSYAGDSQLNIQAAPNPASDMATIDISNQSAHAAVVMLVDQLGASYNLASAEVGGHDQQQIRLNTAELPSGTYRIVVRTASRCISCPLVVVH